MQNNNINVSSVLADITSKSDKDLIEVIRHGYDPKGNRHCFNFGMGPAWWDMQGSANLTEFTRDPMVLLKGAGLDFDVVKALTVSQLPDGNIIESSPKEYNLLRSDDLKVKLQTGVTGGYNITPYREIVQIPNEVIIKPSDFGTDVVSFLQGQHENVDLQDAEMSVNELLSPAGASCWQQGKVMTFQYFIGSFEPRPGDAHRVYFNIESSLDGSKATRYYLTIVRVVCENTQMHAEQDGWAKLLGADKQRQRIRRTSNMDVRIQAWRDGIGSVLAGAAGPVRRGRAAGSRRASRVRAAPATAAPLSRSNSSSSSSSSSSRSRSSRSLTRPTCFCRLDHAGRARRRWRPWTRRPRRTSFGARRR